MFFVMSLGLVAFVLFAIMLFNKAVLNLFSKANARLFETSARYVELIRQKEGLSSQKKNLSQEAMKIFTLYEITKEITKKLNEEEALEIFKAKLKENVDFEECRLLQFRSDECQKVSAAAEYFVFELKGQQEHFGCLAVKSLAEKDKETAMVLSHQFALALRRVKLYRDIEEIAITDGLTGLHTRWYFTQRFEEELARSQKRGIKLSVLMLDVDHFKSFNDQHGHLTGDRILSEVGRMIRESLREIDIAGRYGGEEFSVVLPDTDQKGAQFAALRIKNAVEAALIKVYDVQVKVTVSIGIATFPTDAQKTSELLDKADWALYRAKKQGRMSEVFQLKTDCLFCGLMIKQPDQEQNRCRLMKWLCLTIHLLLFYFSGFIFIGLRASKAWKS